MSEEEKIKIAVDLAKQGIDLEEDKEILYLLDIAINSYIENDILRLDVSDTTKNRLKRDLRKKFRDEDFIYDIKNNIGLIPKSKVKEKLEELDKRIDFLNTELTKCYIEREKLGTETDIDNNETYIFYMEEEKNFREKQKEILQELLREE